MSSATPHCPVTRQQVQNPHVFGCAVAESLGAGSGTRTAHSRGVGQHRPAESLTDTTTQNTHITPPKSQKVERHAKRGDLYFCSGCQHTYTLQHLSLACHH